jgi:hypothetical protein
MQTGTASIHAYNPAIDGDRRSGQDRRKRLTSLRQMMFYGQRQTIRREVDRQRLIWVDKYSPALFILILIVVFLSMVDAILTLFLVNNGATEINPIMAYCLSLGSSTFILAKYALTCISVLMLLILSNVFIARIQIYAKTIFHYIIGVFSCVILWELYLLFRFYACE